MTIPNEEAFARMKSLALPVVFESIWQGQGPRRFQQQWGPPQRFFEIVNDLAKRCSWARNIVPLLEAGRERLIAFDEQQGQFIEYVYGDATFIVAGKSYQQLLAHLFVDLGYAGLDDLVEEVSNAFGFEHLQAFRTFMQEDSELNSADAKRQFVFSR